MSKYKHSATKEPRSQRKRKLFLWALAGLALLVLVAEVFCVYSRAPLWPVSSFWKTDATQEIVVREGMGGTMLAYELFDKHVINNSPAFLEALTKDGADARIKVGTYELSGKDSVEAIINQLTLGPNSDKGKLTIPEGMTVKETANVVEKTLGIPEEAFLAEAKASNFSQEFGFLGNVSQDSLEGYLYGSTYDFSGQTPSAHDVIKTMLSQFQKVTQNLDMSEASEHIKATYGVDMSAYDFLKLASIVQKEGKLESDYPQIAATFYNRMQAHMNLQSDATLAYVLGRSATKDDLSQQNPYNSYLNEGLPPTPICSPALSCIEAALAPPHTDTFYFFIYDNGSYSNHTFSKTYDEHLKAIEDANTKGGASF